jgi:hypothetical protein
VRGTGDARLEPKRNAGAAVDALQQAQRRRGDLGADAVALEDGNAELDRGSYDASSR